MVTKKKRIIGLVLSFTLILMSLVPVVNAANDATGTTYINETFDPDFIPWSVDHGNGNAEDFVKENDTQHGNYAKVNSQIQSGNLFSKSFDPITSGKLVLDFDFLGDSTESNKWIYLSNSDRTVTYASAIIALKNSLRYFDSNKKLATFVSSYDTKVWHHLKFNIDLDNKKYDIYFDNASKSSATVQIAADVISVEKLIVRCNAGSGYICIDNVKLTGGGGFDTGSISSTPIVSAAPVVSADPTSTAVPSQSSNANLHVSEEEQKLVMTETFDYQDLIDKELPLAKTDYGNWNSMGVPPDVKIKSKDSKTYAEISNPTDSSCYFGKRFPYLSEMAIVEFDISFPKGKGEVRINNARYNDDKLACGFGVNGTNMYLNNAKKVTVYDKVSPKQWYHVKFTLNVDKQVYNFELSDDKGILFATPDGQAYPFRNDLVETVGGLSIQPGTQGELDMDNLSVYSAPLKEPKRIKPATKLPLTPPASQDKIISSDQMLKVDSKQPQPTDGDVVIEDKGTTVILKNGLVSFTIEKATAKILAFNYKGGMNLATKVKDPTGGYYELVGNLNTTAISFPTPGKFRVVSTSSDQVDVAVLQDDVAHQGLIMDYHFVLRKGVSGLYTYFTQSSDDNFLDQGNKVSIGESRYSIKFDRTLFPYWQVDDQRKGQFYPSNWPSENVADSTDRYPDGEIFTKYSNSKYMKDDYVDGVSNDKIGLWLVKASNEDIGGGLAKADLTVHPFILNWYLHSGHGGTPQIQVTKGWKKTYGPALWYINSGENREELWKDANQRAEIEKKQWPYQWEQDPAYAADSRGAVKGKINITDGTSPKDAWVIVAEKEPYWQIQCQAYQYWTKADENGNFTVPNIRPGTRSLIILANGVMEQFKKDDIVIQANETTDLGEIKWTPIKNGEQLWQIGTPDRSADEFRNTINPMNWGYWIAYSKEFPNGVDYYIGKSKESTDWNWCQPSTRDNGAIGDFDQGYYVDEKEGRIKYDIPKAKLLDPNDPNQYDNTMLVPWKIHFNCDKDYKGKATLTIAVCANRGGSLKLTVNGTVVKSMDKYPYTDGAIVRAPKTGIFQNIPVIFDASLLKKGENLITLSHVQAGDSEITAYDCLRLEVDENANADENASEEVNVIINGTKQNFDQPPVIINGRTLVPMRSIFEALGATVTWDEHNNAVTAVLGNTKIELTVGQQAAIINDETKPLDVPSQFVNDKTMVPVRFISEALGAKVDWDEDTQTVIIDK